MSKGVKVLNQEQQDILRAALDAQADYMDTLDIIKALQREELRKGIAGVLARRDRLVREAVRLGVPKSRIQEGVLGTKNWLALEKILKGGN